jgi:DNA-binding HxlR family transcriptional regulator
MRRKIDGASREKILDELLEKHAQLDSMCIRIFFTLQGYENLRFNQLLRTLRKLGTKISQPTLSDHLQHLLEKNLIEKEEGFQVSIYRLREDINAVLNPSPEELRQWLDTFDNDENLPKHLRPLKFSREDLFKKLSDQEIDDKTVKDLADIITRSLYELKSVINFDLEISKYESDEAFWKFVGNPAYRMQEKSIVEDCRSSEEYKKRLFKKIDLLINELRSDKELFRKREERRKKRFKK